jgi:hypothetical protein
LSILFLPIERKYSACEKSCSEWRGAFHLIVS